VTGRHILLRTTITMPPQPKGRPRTSPAQYKQVGHDLVLTRAARTYTPARTKAYEEKLAWMLRSAGARPVTGDLGIDLVFHTDRRGDADNLLKAVLDAGNGVMYVDDAQIVDIRVRIVRDTPARTDLILFRPGELVDTDVHEGSRGSSPGTARGLMPRHTGETEAESASP